MATLAKESELEHLTAVREDLLDKLQQAIQDEAQAHGDIYRNTTKVVDYIRIEDDTTVHEILFELGKKGWPIWEVQTYADESSLLLQWHQPYTEEEIEQQILDYQRRVKGTNYGAVGRARQAIADVEQLIIKCVLG